MLWRKAIIGATALALLGGSLYAKASTSTGARFPKHYRNWTVAKGRMVGPNSPNVANGGGFRYIYVNRIGRDGYGDPPFEEGTVLIDERVQATEDGSGVFQEGPTLHVGVMVKDSRRCEDTGGWCFNFFTGNDTTVGIPPQAQKNCFTQCHGTRPDTDFVFSKFRRHPQP